MTEKIYTTENGTYTETELSIFQSVGAFLTNYREEQNVILELHQLSESTLVNMYKAINGGIQSCLLAEEIPNMIMDMLISLSSFVAHEIARRQTGAQ